MKKRLLIVFYIFLVVGVSAQTASEGEVLFNNKQFAKARIVYEALLKKKPNDALNNYRLARCCYELNDYETAIKHFELSGPKYPLKNLYLGELYFNTYRFELAVQAYQTYLSTLKPDDKAIKDLEVALKKSELGAKLLNRVEDIAIVDSMLVNKKDFLKYYQLSSEAGSLKQTVIKQNQKQIVDKIEYTTERGDRKFFSDSVAGKMNLFSAIRLLDAWGTSAPLSKTINTSANENYPFLMLDGITLYFASDGENSLGGYDIMITRYSPVSKDYLTPENVGFPFNSTANDYMLAIDEQRGLGWFATDRNQSSDKVMIYKFIPNKEVRIVKVTDNDSLRYLAGLKVYRKGKLRMNDQINTQGTEPVESVDNDLYEIVINDSTIYKHVTDFKSPEALNKFKEWKKLSFELKSAKQLIDQKREQYVNVSDDAQRTKLTQEIVQLESKISLLEKNISAKLTEISNEELKYLNKTLK